MKDMQGYLTIPKGYTNGWSVKDTAIAIKKIKDYFERRLARELNLTRVSAPLFVHADSGLNDNLSGVERPVAFDVKGIGGEVVEIVHSLAKWKRIALYNYGFDVGEGLYTDMNAIRRDEELGNLHSIYVDQWDWEKIIRKEDRNIDTLKKTVKDIYKVFKDTELYLSELYPQLTPILPEEIYFITTQELEDRYPDLSPEARENTIAKEKGAVFIMQIGDYLKSGNKHDGRAPDYDDWQLNGDILFWYPVLNRAMELSSMGIRVDEEALERQIKLSKCEDRKELAYHQLILNKKLPYSIGGGIGQSRICMFLLRKAHIGEVQAAIWPEEMVEACREAKIHLL